MPQSSRKIAGVGIRGRTTWIVAFLLSASAAHALDPRRAPSQYVLRKWDAGTLGSNTIHAIVQTRDGYLWFGTGAGLVRHDGARFVAIDTGNRGAGASSLAEGAEGSLYVGSTVGAVTRYQHGQSTPLPLRPTGPVHVLRATRDGVLWIGQFGRPVARWKPGAPTHYFESDVTTVSARAIVEDAAGTLWVGSADGLMRLEGERFGRGAATSDVVQALLADGAVLWIGTQHGLLRAEGDVVRRFTMHDGLPHDRISALVRDRDGNLWVGTPAGLSRWSGGRFATLTSRDGLPDDDVRSLLEDRDGNLWVGTGDGLACVSGGRFITYGLREGLRDPAIASVIGAREGGAWLGTASAEVVRLHPDGRTETFELPVGHGLETVHALYEARDAALWIAVSNGRVFRLHAGVFREHTPVLDAQKRQNVTGFFEDETGVGVLVVRMGLAHLRGRRVVPHYDGADQLIYPHMIHRDKAGTLWMATSGGLARLDAAGPKVFRTEDGLPHNRVRWISEDEDGGLWLATGGGLAHFTRGVFRHIATEQGLPESFLRVVLDDGHGHLWIAGQANIFRVDKREVLAVLAGKAARLTPIRFDTTDGLRTTEGLLSSNPAFRDAEGRLWFATTKGVSVVDPRQVTVDQPAPPVTIETLSVDGRPADPRARAEYGPGRGEVMIEYAALAFESPHRVQFRYRLAGLNDDWVEAGTRRYAYYGALPAGRYRFEVMASNPDGVWSGAPTSLELAIRPPFVRTPLFYLLCIGALGLIAAAAHHLRARQMHARFAAILHERTRIARELHDTLGQAVAGVGLQIETGLRALDAEQGSAREHLRRAHAMARASLDEVRRSIWVLRAQTSRGDDLATTLSHSLGQLTEGAGLAATLDVRGRPRTLPMAIERNVLRITYEAVTNVVRHAGAKHLAVTVDFGDDVLALGVKDDGRGFDAEPHLAAKAGLHFGLLGIVERVRVLGGTVSIESRPGAGTEISCRVPYGARAHSAEVDGDGPAAGE